MSETFNPLGQNPGWTVHLWKARLRIAPSAGEDSREIHLYVVWRIPPGEDAMPTAAQKADPLLWSIWRMKTGWAYYICTKYGPNGVGDQSVYVEEKDALAEYKRRCKDFPRSKDCLYSYPVVDEGAGS